jgi:hypothetical protein
LLYSRLLSGDAQKGDAAICADFANLSLKTQLTTPHAPETCSSKKANQEKSVEAPASASTHC